MLDETESPTDTEHAADASSWEERQLCPDGNCVGVIGPEGRCKECGLAAPEPRENGGSVVSGRGEGDDRSDGDLSASDEAAVEGSLLGTSSDESDDLADRRLCPDGSCLGLLDEEGRCKICGQVGD